MYLAIAKSFALFMAPFIGTYTLFQSLATTTTRMALSFGHDKSHSKHVELALRSHIDHSRVKGKLMTRIIVLTSQAEQD